MRARQMTAQVQRSGTFELRGVGWVYSESALCVPPEVKPPCKMDSKELARAIALGYNGNQRMENVDQGGWTDRQKGALA